jgi:hypothetical protein
MVPRIKLSQLYIFVSVILFIARGLFERSKACADLKSVVNSKSVIFSRKFYLILSIKRTSVNYYHLITSLATVNSTRLLIVIQSLVFTTFYGRSLTCKKRLLASSYLFVRPSSWNYSAPTGWIFMKTDM